MSTEQVTDRSETHVDIADPEPLPSTPCRWFRKRVALYATLVALVSIGGWRLFADGEYWRAAWDQGTFAPVCADPRLVGSGEASPPRFDLTATTIPIEEILSGGPPKDGIPAITDPTMIDGDNALYLNPSDRVVGVAIGGASRAYPLRILNYHEIVNDTMEGTPIAVTYCPLCDSVAVFDRRTPLGLREFGVSGLLYNSNVLFYDRSDQESLWSQVSATGVSGPAAGESLTMLPGELTSWSDWQKRHPQGKVMSIETGHTRNYAGSPYTSYFDRDELMFPAKPLSDELPNKEPVLGVWTNGQARAYPISSFENRPGEFQDTIGGEPITLHYDPNAFSLRVANASDNVQWLYSFWFAWHAFRPETEVHSD